MNTGSYSATVDPAWDLGTWRTAARAALRANIAPEAIAWNGDAQGSLLAGIELSSVPPLRATPHVPASFFDIANTVLCHRDPQRYALLYRIAWRIAQGEPHLLARVTDANGAEVPETGSARGLATGSFFHLIAEAVT